MKMWSKRFRICIVAMLLPWCAACSSVRLTYGQGPVLAYWWLDGYVDFSAEQAPRVRQALDDWFAWHRATQLPDYAAFLVGVRRLAVDDVTPALVCRQLDELERRAEQAVLHAVPAMAEIVRGFSAEQLDHLEQRFIKADAELVREHLKPPPAERHEKLLKRALERAESFYGPLDDRQRRLLAEGVATTPFDPRSWLEERQARQREIVADLRRVVAERADAAATETALRSLVLQFRHSPRAAYRAYRERLAQANCRSTARLHNAASAAQRRRLVDKLDGWEGDLRSLARPPERVTAPATPSPAGG